jgi:hypothetical protein
MPGLEPFQPDANYCVYCHKVAAGRCAICHALLCGDCAVLAPGLSRPLAVCPGCASRSIRPGRTLVVWLLLALFLLAAVVFLVLWVIR